VRFERWKTPRSIGDEVAPRLRGPAIVARPRAGSSLIPRCQRSPCCGKARGRDGPDDDSPDERFVAGVAACHQVHRPMRRVSRWESAGDRQRTDRTRRLLSRVTVTVATTSDRGRFDGRSRATRTARRSLRLGADGLPRSWHEEARDDRRPEQAERETIGFRVGSRATPPRRPSGPVDERRGKALVASALDRDDSRRAAGEGRNTPVCGRQATLDRG